MRQLIVTEFMSLDGVVDSPGGGDHPRAGWTFSEVAFDEAAYELKGTEQEQAGALLLGRRTYEEFAPVWPDMDDEFARYNRLPKYVVSTTLETTDPRWTAEILRDLDAVARLKETDGDPLYVHGSPGLVRSLASAGLVDRYHLLVFPVVLGSGRRLFTDGDDTGPGRLALLEQEAYRNGVVKLVYEVRREA